MELKQGIEKVEQIVEELTELLNDLDTVSCNLYPDSSDSGAVILDTAFMRITDQKDELLFFIDEAKKGRM